MTCPSPQEAAQGGGEAGVGYEGGRDVEAAGGASDVGAALDKFGYPIDASIRAWFRNGRILTKDSAGSFSAWPLEEAVALRDQLTTIIRACELQADIAGRCS